jgi:hypothetical protein
MSNQVQPSLFEMLPSDPSQGAEPIYVASDGLTALDEMFAASRQYRSSKEYMSLMRFVGRFSRYSPFNCMLLYTQNPAVSHVATARQWWRKFARYPKHDARPLVILAPMSPVLFVYDLMETEGRPVPESALMPFHTHGKLSETVYDRTVHNARLHGIAVRDSLLAHQHAGSAMKLNASLRKQHAALKVDPAMRYLVLINKGYSLEDKYSSLAHELAHIFCGHVGTDAELDWWQPRGVAEKNAVEIEAESVAYLVCQRRALEACSDKYLAGYDTDEAQELPFFGLNAIFTATFYIEDMGASAWEKPKKMPPKRRKPAQA